LGNEHLRSIFSRFEDSFTTPSRPLMTRLSTWSTPSILQPISKCLTPRLL